MQVDWIIVHAVDNGVSLPPRVRGSCIMSRKQNNLLTKVPPS